MIRRLAIATLTSIAVLWAYSVWTGPLQAADTPAPAPAATAVAANEPAPKPAGAGETAKPAASTNPAEPTPAAAAGGTASGSETFAPATQSLLNNFNINDFLLFFQAIVLEALPFIVFGAIISGMLEELLPQQFFQRFLPSNRFLAIVGSSVAGIFLPMCECGIVPVMRRLIKKGVPASCAITYMLSAPGMNFIVLGSTAMAFWGFADLFGVGGLGMLLLRGGSAFVTAVLVGLILDSLSQDGMQLVRDKVERDRLVTTSESQRLALVDIQPEPSAAPTSGQLRVVHDIGDAPPSGSDKPATPKSEGGKSPAAADHDHKHGKCDHDHGHKHGSCDHDHDHDHSHEHHHEHDHGKADAAGTAGKKEAGKVGHDHEECCGHDHHDHTHEHHHDHGHEHEGCCGHDHGHAKPPQRTLLQRAIAVADIALGDFLDIAAFLVIGAALAAFVSVTVDKSSMAALAQRPGVGVMLMMGLAMLLSLCSEADAFVAANFRSLTFGPKLAFLVVGPMLDVKLFIMYRWVFTPKAVWIMIGSILSIIFVIGVSVDLALPWLAELAESAAEPAASAVEAATGGAGAAAPGQ